MVRAHLNDCQLCQARLDQLSEVPPLSDWAQRCGSVPLSPADEPALAPLLERLAQLPPVAVSAPVRPSTGERLSFLRPPVKPGELGTLGPYQVLSVLGRGGMGIALLAYDPVLERAVALKVLRPDRADETARARFVREAQAVAALEHDHVIAIYSVVNPSDTPPYLVMPYVSGPTLRERIQQEQHLPPAEAARICLQVARGLSAAHKSGLVHRDIKPSNIILDLGSDRAKIMDFGLVRIKEPSVDITQEGALVGTPEYMSPEQIQEPERIDERSDVYSLGVSLYEALTGQPPFRGELHVVMQQVLYQEPIAPRRLNEAIPRDLETICLKTMAKEPQRRYQSAEELAEDLRRWLSGEPIQARRVGWREKLWFWCRRNPALAGACAVAALALVTVVGLSVGLAIHRSLANARLVQQEQRTREALDESEQRGQELLALAEHLRQEKQALQETDRRRYQAVVQAVELARDQGLALFDRGDPGAGLLWLAHGLELAPAREEALQESIRLLMGSWWDTRSLRTIMTPGAWTYGAAISPNGELLATGHDNKTARVWEMATGKAIGPPLPHGAGVYALAFSPDNKTLLTAGLDRTTKLWHVETGKPLGQPQLHPVWVRALAFSPDGKTFLAGGVDGSVRLWDLGTGKPTMTVEPHPPDRVCAVAFSPDGKTLATGCKDGKVRLYDAATSRLLTGPFHHRTEVWALAFSSDARTLLTGRADNTTQLLETATGQRRGSPQWYPDIIRALRFSPSGQTIVTSGGKAPVRVWKTRTDQPARTFDHLGSVWTAAFSPDGKSIVTGGQDCQAQHWSTASGQPLTPPLRHEGHIHAVAFSPDGKILLTGSQDRTAKLWDAATGALHAKPLLHENKVLAVGFSPDGQIAVTGGQDRMARFWNVSTGDDRGQIHVPDWVSALAVSPDGQLLATAGRTTTDVRLWHLPTRTRQQELDHPEFVKTLAFSPDGKLLLTGSMDGGARLWDVTTGRTTGPILEHEGSVLAVAFSPTGKVVLTGGADATVRLWDVKSGRRLGRDLTHPKEVTAVAFSPNGETFLTGCADGKTRFWKVPAAVVGEREQILQQVQVITGMELSAKGVVHPLDAVTWHSLRQQALQRKDQKAP